MNTLIIAAHPTLESSRINRKWLEEAAKYPEQITISSLYEKYPDGTIDIAAEQALVETHDRIILQFPFYWFSSPPMMKQWLDEVLLEGWAFGDDSWLFIGKTIGLAVSTGLRSEDYSPSGDYLHEISTLLLPFEMTARYLQSSYEEPFIEYGVNSRTSDKEIALSAERYMKYALQTREVQFSM